MHLSRLTPRGTPPPARRPRPSLLGTLLRGLVAFALAAAGLIAAVVVTAGPAQADYTSSNLPNWAIGPFTRAAQNPLLTAQGTGFESNDVFNPGVVVRNGTFQMLYRGQDSKGVSAVGYATSTNGTTFTRSASNPVISGTLPSETGGIEDPRLYELDGTYYSFFTGVAGGSVDIDEATSTDLVHWTQLGPVVTDNKDAAVLTDPSDTPVLVNGKYVMYFGEQSHGGEGITYSTDMIHWSGNASINLHFPSNYQPYEICVTVTDYQTVKGAPANNNVLMFVSGTLMAQGKWYYGISEVEFSGSNLTQQIGQLTDATLSPTTSYELNGQTKNCVFMNSITYYNGQWYMYYGAGDTVVALATAQLRSAPEAPFSSTSFETGQRLPDWVDQVDTSAASSGGTANVGGFPGYSLTAPETSLRAETAHTGTESLMYSGSANGAATDYAYTQVFDLSASPITVSSGTTLSYWIYPQSSSRTGVTGGTSSCVALDLIFTDGTALRNSGAVDENGNRLHPASQCGHLPLDQWDHVTSTIGAKVSGKTISRIDLGFDEPGGSGGYRGYVDDIAITS
ncbi:MAG TPA: hypothetical protein VGX23_12345 [Actinocrinis sp.]|nr:hypothetical protein [Actinocrinis sp.]